MNELVKYDEDGSIEKEILGLVHDIPFENSYAQTRSVVNSALVPQKAFKVIGLRLMKRLNDLKVCSIKREQTENEIAILQYERDHLGDTELDVLHQKRIDLEIKEKLAGFDYEMKLSDDCKAELVHLYGMIKNLPKYTRAEFEEGEKVWLNLKLDAARKGRPEPVTPHLAEMIEQGRVPTLLQIGVMHNIKRLEK